MLMESDTEAARKPLALTFAAARHTRGSFLTNLLGEVAVLHTISLDYVAFCPSVMEKTTKRHLSRCTLNVLCYGHHVGIVGKTIDKRAKHHVAIAFAYTPDELFSESRISQITMTEIPLWLEERGASLRSLH